MENDLATSLQTPVGILAWTAIHASWKVRCVVKQHPEARHSFALFLKRWIMVLRSLAQARCYTFISSQQVRLFITGVESLQQGTLQHPSLIINPPPPRPAAAKPQRQLERKHERAPELETLLPQLSEEGYHVVFTDGSSKEVAGIGTVAGYGIFSSDCLSILAYVPVHLRQTNNTAELFATVRALQILQPGRYAFCSDSSYVILGASGAAKWWKIGGRKGSCGPVANVAIWEELLHELDQPGKTIRWVKVPSHMSVEGNNKADHLADLGRLSSPLHPVLSTPSSVASPHTPSFAPSEKARLSPILQHDSPDVLRRIVFGSPACVSFASVTANDILRSPDLEPIYDTDNFVSMSHSTDDSGSDTVSMGSSSDNDSAYITDISDTRKWRRNLKVAPHT